MFRTTALTELLGIRLPLIQAPMAGGITTSRLITAVSNAGALGSLAAALLSPEQIAAAVAEIRAGTERPFAVNLFVLEPVQADPAQLARANALLAPIRAELGLPQPPVPERFAQDFAAQFDALLEARPPVASFTFGILDRDRMRALRQRGIVVIGTATTVAEARAWEAVGADAVCAQGAEAGGHRGTFLGDFERALIGTMALVPQVADAVRVPVIAAGGIMDGRGIAAALTLGAAGCQLGTAFLSCPEAAIPAGYKARLRQARDDETVVTRAFSGRPARGLFNDYLRRLQPHQHEFPPYPIQNALTGDIRRAAAAADRPDYLSLWAGQGAPMSRALPAAELVATLAAETEQALAARNGL